ncbi:MAG: hypothetical protein ACXVAY_21795 [Mucilaginibacter sp.]
MKPIYLIFLSLLLVGCLKANIAPVTSKSQSSSATNTVKTDSLASYDWFNGTKGTAIIKVTCNNCTALATIGNITTPFIFNDQGVGELKYTPASGLSVYIAVCPGSVKTIKADIFDATNISLFTYSGVSGNWNSTYIIK